MPYVTAAEREVARAAKHLKAAQSGLALARVRGNRDEVKRWEQHVCRLITYLGNAYDAVNREHKRRLDIGPMWQRGVEIATTFDVRS
jgi:hypothetical protein